MENATPTNGSGVLAGVLADADEHTAFTPTRKGRSTTQVVIEVAAEAWKASLPLSAWAAARAPSPRKPGPLAARILGRRHHLSPVRAALLAALAGFCVEESI